MNEQINAWSRSGDGLPSHRQATAPKVPMSLDPTCSRASGPPQKLQHPHAWCLCCVIVLPSHTPNHPRCSALDLRTGCLCWRRVTCSTREAVCGEVHPCQTLRRPCQVESHRLPQAQEQFKLPQMGCSGHSCVVKFSFLGGRRIMGNLRSPIAVHLLAWDGTVPKPWDVLYQQGADRSELSMYLRIHLSWII